MAGFSEEAVFQVARQIGRPDVRRLYLDQACGSDPALRDRVDALLRAHDEERSFLERPAVAAFAPGPETAAFSSETRAAGDGPPPAVGARVGPYRLLQQLGEGGMGAVFLAEQTHPVRRQVALKVIKAGMDSRQVVARFEAERQALALMDHPHIARVFDGGETPSGRPYFVMELVKGVPITAYCDRDHLPLRERLGLFAQVCGAIQHAHQKGIIHRDIKPSNVLVSRHDTTPVVKVIDFGVAKALGQELTDKTLFTGVAQMIGTPLYMSPEQAGMSDLDVDTRSDVYALGVLLYELLTGTTPFEKERFKTVGYDEIRRIIREEEPPRPSTRLSTLAQAGSTVAEARGTDPRRLSKLFRGELDWVVMKALEKDRTRRYETAAGFAADVRRYLADEPVLACPPSASYRVRKFARRNRRALTTAFVSAVALLVGVGAVAGSVGWAARDRAAREAAVEAEAGRAFDEAERWMAQEKWSEALDTIKRGKGVMAGGGSDALRDRAEQLQTDVEMMLRLEAVGQQVAELKAGWHEWDAVHDGYAKAFADYGIDVLGLPADEAAARVRARDRLSIPLAGALDLWSCCHSPKTAPVFGQLRAVAVAADPDPWRVRVREAVQRNDGAALAELARSPDLARQPRTSVGLLEHGLRHCGQPGVALDLLRKAQRNHPGDFWANYWLAHELFWLPNADFSEVVSFARAAVAARSKSAAAHLLLALALQRLRKLDEAVPHHLEALALAPDNPFAHHDYGGTLYHQGKYEEALAAYQKAIDLWPGNHHAYYFRGLVYGDLKKLDEAVADYRKSTELNPNGPYAGQAHTALGTTLLAQGKPDEAIDAYRRYAELHPQWNAAGLFCDTVQSVKPRDEAVAIFEAVGRQNPRNGQLLLRIAHKLSELGEHDRALRLSHKALEIEPNDAHILHNIGAVLRRQKKYDEALVYFDRAIAIDPKDLWAVLGRGQTLRSKRDLTAAAAAFRRGIEIDATSADAHLFLAEVLLDQGDGRNAFLSCRQVLRWAARPSGLENFHPKLVHMSLRLAVANDPKLRHPALAVEFAWAALLGKETVDCLSTLGVANYRAGSFVAAVAALERAIQLRGGLDGRDGFYLALAHRHLGDRGEARRWYDAATAWTNRHKPSNPELTKLRAEAAAVLGLAAEVAPRPREKKEPGPWPQFD